MRINHDQFTALASGTRRSADLRLVDYLKSRFPNATRSAADEKLLRFVVSVRERACQHDICEEPDLATVLDLSVMYGSDFYNATWASDVFQIKEWSASKKIRILRDRVRRRVADF